MKTENADSWWLELIDHFDRLIVTWRTYRLLILLTVSVACVILVLRWRIQTTLRNRDLSCVTKETATWSQTPNPYQKERGGRDGTDTRTGIERKARPAAARIVAGRKPLLQRQPSPSMNNTIAIRPLIFYSSLTGTAKALSEQFQKDLTLLLSEKEDCIVAPELFDLADIELDDFFISHPKITPNVPNENYFYIVIIPSYDIDTNMTLFLDHLQETHHDFRIDTAPLASLVGYSVFGIGDEQGWPADFCRQAVQVDKWMAKLTGKKRAYPLGFGDVKSDAKDALKEWTNGLYKTILDISKLGTIGEGVPGSGDAVESDEEELEEAAFPDNKRNKKRRTQAIADLEDVGGRKPASVPPAIDFTTYSDPSGQSTLKQMVPKSSPTYTALTKQGYTIVGSHSGVKICRWTKSALRGRGSCYKNSFYGIASHLCMETTPSLSCSNKCVFCWRHGTNPVSTTWRWEVDDPEMIFNGAKQGHYQKIKMMRGVPGVRADRFEEAMRIRHCALSLVGEPIFYPHINEFLDLLHGEQISSFLVCNAQHPQQLQDLKRVTQLYVSIDASNKESLRKVDRPLHRDFWERFQSCLSILKEKRFIQRTVFRLTLVKGFNMADEIEGYAALIEKALPCFVEVKGVTYCGTSTSAGAGLTMQNVPFYEEICAFVEALNSKLEEKRISDIDGGYGYGIAAEHAHSCCILLASKRFFINNKWCTRINYEKFFQLLKKEELGSNEIFGPEEYCQETEDWALWGNGGFDPRDQRVDRKGRPKELPPGGTPQHSHQKNGSDQLAVVRLAPSSPSPPQLVEI